ncbi:MAG: hypothetical protein E4H14_02210 [Candidatus Thorarchaeota archaeon]|nr:MAG: hypothetical protein E4H14_02210 [Candidatus Thorarchaeota archaeon]
MEDEVICPQCGQALDETIPITLVGSIQVKCPFCDMIYSFQRQEDKDTLEEEAESYLSDGPFRGKLVFSDKGAPRERDPFTKQFSCLVLCLFGPMIIFGIYLLITFLILFF